MSVVAFTFTALIVYLGLMKLVAYVAYSRSTKSTEDYFLANRNVGLIALVATTVASVFSTGTVVSTPSEFYSEGSQKFWLWFFVGVPVIMMPFAIKFWQLGKSKGYITPGEMFADFFQSKRLGVITAIIGVLSAYTLCNSSISSYWQNF